MTVATMPHIEVDEKGTAWVAGANVKVLEIVADKLAHGFSPEEMQIQYPHLSAAQIYAALAYYYDHKTELDSQLERDHQEIEALRAAAGESPGRKRLRALGYLP